MLLKEEQTAAYSVEIWKRFRKWGGVPTGITQNIKDLLASREIENIFENSDFIYMLNQASGDRQILAKQLNISPFQLSYVTNSNEGEGLLFYGNTIVPFKDKLDTSLKLHSLMTTKPNEMGKYKEKKGSMNTPNIFDRLSRKIHHHSDMEPHESDSGPPFGEVEPLNFHDEESVVHTVLEDFYAVGTLADELTAGFHMEAHGYLDREEVNTRLIAFARKLEQVLDKWETHAALIA